MRGHFNFESQTASLPIGGYRIEEQLITLHRVPHGPLLVLRIKSHDDRQHVQRGEFDIHLHQRPREKKKLKVIFRGENLDLDAFEPLNLATKTIQKAMKAGMDEAMYVWLNRWLKLFKCAMKRINESDNDTSKNIDKVEVAFL